MQEPEQKPGQPDALSDLDGTGAAQAPSETPEASLAAGDPVRDLNAELQAAQAKAEEHYDAFLRTKAELENIRRRAQEDVAKARKFGIESFAEALVPVFDSLEAALADPGADVAQLREGVELTLRQLSSAFEKNRLLPINPVGAKFDPHLHQAISAQPAPDVAPNHVVSVLQKGWIIADRVVRPALVTVSQPG
jgi:molecular chaperone GrpE